MAGDERGEPIRRATRLRAHTLSKLANHLSRWPRRLNLSQGLLGVRCYMQGRNTFDIGYTAPSPCRLAMCAAVRLPSKTRRECGHHFSPAMCHCTKSLRDSCEVRPVLSTAPTEAMVGRRRGALSGASRSRRPHREYYTTDNSNTGRPIASHQMKHERSDHLVTWDRTTIILTRGSKEFRLDNREPRSGL
jgi:hypothetical protein